jgi:hypothetical protein
MSTQPSSNPSQSDPSTRAGGSQQGGGSPGNVNKDDAPQRSRDPADGAPQPQNIWTVSRLLPRK